MDTTRLRGSGSGGAVSRAVASAADIEALPREVDEQVLETRRGHGEPAHGYPGADQRREQVLGSVVAGTTSNLSVDGHHVGDSQAG